MELEDFMKNFCLSSTRAADVGAMVLSDGGTAFDPALAAALPK